MEHFITSFCKVTSHTGRYQDINTEDQESMHMVANSLVIKTTDASLLRCNDDARESAEPMML